MTLSVWCRIWKAPGFSLDLLDVEGMCPPIWRTKYNGGHRHYGGPNFDRLYHTLKVLLLLLLLCISQFQAWPPPMGNFLKGWIPHGHKESAKPWPLGQKNRAETPPRGNYFQKSSKKNSTEMLICLEILKQWNI